MKLVKLQINLPKESKTPNSSLMVLVTNEKLPFKFPFFGPGPSVVPPINKSGIRQAMAWKSIQCNFF